MATVADVEAAAPSFAGGVGYPNCGRQTKAPPTLRMNRQGTEARMAWKVLKAEADAALTAIGGVAETATIFGQSVSRIVPLRHPDYPDWLICDEVSATDMGWDTAAEREEFTHIEVVFRTPNYDITGDSPYVEFSGDPAVRTVPSPAAAWLVDGLAPHRDPDLEIGGADFQLVLHNCPTIDLGPLLTYSRYVNSAPWYGCPVGTVLYHGPRWNRQIRLGNQSSWQIGLAFSATSPECPWNYYGAADGSLAELATAGSVRRYPAVNFNLLFA